jgi:hypothetical protein
MNLLGPAPAPGAEALPLPPPRVRTARQRWTTRGVLGALGLFGLGIFHQFNYSRRVPVWRDSMFMVEEELLPEVTAVTGELKRYPWWDVRGLTLTWEWRPRAWFRELWGQWRGTPPMSPATEHEGWTRFWLRGERHDAEVEGRARLRAGREWQLVELRVAVPTAGRSFVLMDRREALPENMLRRRA